MNDTEFTDSIEVQVRRFRGRKRYVVIENIEEDELLAAAESAALLGDREPEEMKPLLVERAIKEVLLKEVPAGADVTVKTDYDVEV